MSIKCEYSYQGYCTKCGIPLGDHDLECDDCEDTLIESCEYRYSEGDQPMCGLGLGLFHDRCICCGGAEPIKPAAGAEG